MNLPFRRALACLALLAYLPCGPSFAESLILGPASEAYSYAAVSDHITVLEMQTNLTGSVAANHDVRLKFLSHVSGDVRAVGTIDGDGQVDGQRLEGADPTSLPAIPAMNELRALADRIIQGPWNEPGDQVIDDFVFVEGNVHFQGMVRGQGTIVAAGDIRFDGPHATSPDSYLSLIALGDVRFAMARTFRGVVRAARDVDLEMGVSVEGVLIAGRNVHLKRSSTVTWLPPDRDPPVLELVTPADESLLDRSPLTIVVNWSDASSGIDVSSASLRVDGMDRTAEASLGESGLIWILPYIMADGVHSIEVTVQDAAGLEAQLLGGFSIATPLSPPQVYLLSPRARTIYAPPEILITYSDSDPGVDLESLVLEVNDVDISSSCVISQDRAACEPSLAVGDHVLHVALSDLEGATNDFSHEFELVADIEPPSIVVTTPEPNQLSNRTLVNVHGTFSDDGEVSAVRVGDQEFSIDGSMFHGFLQVGIGETTITVEALDAAGNVGSSSRTVRVDLRSPDVAIEHPKSDTTTHLPEVRVMGRVTDENEITATSNSQPIDLEADGSFDSLVALSPGENAVPLSFADAAGNITRLLLEVSYQPLAEVSLIEPADFTTTSNTSILVRGVVGPDATSVNVSGTDAVVEGDGSFEAVVDLKEGRNSLTAWAASPDARPGMATRTILRDTTPPRLTIETPGDGQTIETDRLLVRGMVADPVSGFDPPGTLEVMVNGVQAEVSRGTYVAEIQGLEPGVSPVLVEATDALGNRSSLTREVNYSPRLGRRLMLSSGNRQVAEIGTHLAEPLEVRALDSAGQPIAGITVVFAVDGNDGLLEATDGAASGRKVAVITDFEGSARTSFRLGTFAGLGTQRVRASAVGFGLPKVFAHDAIAGPPDRLVVDSGNGQVGVATEPLPRELVAVAVDSAGNRLAGVEVLFRVAEGNGTLSNEAQESVVITDSKGRAVERLRGGNEVGVASQIVRAGLVDQPERFASFVSSTKTAGDPSLTRFSGVVLDNTDQPVPGVEIHISGTQLTTTSGPDGRFAMNDVPIGDVLVEVDASTTDRPGGWPHLEFEMFFLPGVDNRFDRPFYVLPLDPKGLIVSETQGGTLTLEDVPGFALEVAPGSVTFPDGSKSGTVGVTPVHTDRIPMEPNFGQQPRFVITIQPGGAKFDPPARLTLPNVSGLAPGRVVSMFSFDHDLGRFVGIGHGTVSDDGTVIASNPGVGVVEAGWHCGADPEDDAGATHTCPTCQECTGDSCGLPTAPSLKATCNDGDRCTINDRCQQGVCRGDFVRIEEIQGPCVVAVDEPATFTAIANGAHLLKWRGGGNPAMGNGSSFTTTFPDSFLPEGQTEGPTTISASCALSGLKEVAIGRDCSTATPEYIETLEVLPLSEDHGEFKADYEFEAAGCITDGKWCFRLKSFTAQHKIFIKEAYDDRQPIYSLDEVTEENCEDVISSITPRADRARPGTGNEPRPSFLDYVPIPIVRVHEEAHLSASKTHIGQPLSSHMASFLESYCRNCAPRNFPTERFDKEFTNHLFILQINFTYNLNTSNVDEALTALQDLDEDPVDHDEGQAYRQSNGEAWDWVRKIRKKAKDEGWTKCR